MGFVRALIICLLIVGVGSVSVSRAIEESGSEPDLSPWASISLGYRAVNVEDYGRRAAQYSLLESGPTAAVEIKALKPLQRFRLDGIFLDDSDYFVDTDYDYKGLLRANFISESLVHNLDHISYQRPDADIMGIPRVVFSDNNPGKNYSLDVQQDSFKVKGKLPEYPAHLTFGYWRLERSGHKQLRYVDESCNSCHVNSRSQKIDRVTEQISLGLDAHIGHVNVALEHVLREFSNREAIPTDSFGTMNSIPPFPAGRTPGSYQHDETPDSRYYATTLKGSTSPSGGLVAAAAFTVGKKENRSDLGVDIQNVETETDFRKGSADLTLIPSPLWTFNFRYRFLDTDTSNSPSITVLNGSPFTYQVRQSIDLTKATYGARASFRPSPRLTLKGEFERNELHRDNTWVDDLDSFDLFWKLPEDENVNRFRLSLISRPLNSHALKINSWYQFLTSDDPAYGNSLEEKHEVYAGASWNPSTCFGITGNIRLSRGENSNFSRSLIDSGVLFTDDIDRSEKREEFTSSIWLQPVENFNLNLHCGFLRSDIRQDLVFGTTSDSINDNNVDSLQKVHTATLSANWQILKPLKGIFEGRYIHSNSSYDPDFPAQRIFGFDVNSSLLDELSEVEIRQMGLALGLEWQIDEFWRGSARISRDDYEDRNSSAFDGSVEYYMLTIARAW